jgi:hypothetical protein
MGQYSPGGCLERRLNESNDDVPLRSPRVLAVARIPVGLRSAAAVEAFSL